MANAFNGLVSMNPVSYKSPVVMARLWIHETRRVYADRMVNQTDVDRFEDFLGLHTPTRWYKFSTRVSSDICIQGEPCKRAELVRHVRAVAKLAGGIRVLRAKKD